MAEIQAAYFKFGKARVPDDPKPMWFLRTWMDEHCRDWRLVEGDQVAVEFVLYKPMPAKKFRSLMAHHVKNWGFKREAYARDNCRPMSIDDYLKSPVGDWLKFRVWVALRRAYWPSEVRAQALDDERAKARRERAKARRERAKARKEARRTNKAHAKARQRIRKRFLRA